MQFKEMKLLHALQTARGQRTFFVYILHFQFNLRDIKFIASSNGQKGFKIY
jgi:hypothetical protein